MNLHRLRQEMQTQGMDAVVAVSPENFFYTTGIYLLTQKLIRDRLAITVIPASGEPTVIVCSIEESLAIAESGIPDIRTYVEFGTSPIAALVEVLQEKGLRGKRIGIELRYLSAHYFTELARAMPETDFPECGQTFSRTRVIKEAREIEQLRIANAGTHQAIMGAFAAARPGDTEAKIAADITTRIIAAGGAEPFLVLSTGDRTVQAHPQPGNTPIKPGDLVKVDCGGLFAGYYGDVARTVTVVKAEPRYGDVWARLAEIQRTVVDACQVGTPVKNLYFLCKEQFEKHGLPFRMPHIGHSMGVELHEEPMMNPFTDTLLQPNMVLNVEPITIVDGRGFHTEDLIQITPTGPVPLTRPSLDEPLFAIGG